MKKVSSRFGVSQGSRRSHSESRRRIAFAIFSGLFTAAIPVGSVTPASAATVNSSISWCETIQINGVDLLGGVTTANLTPGDLGTSWNVLVQFWELPTFPPGQSDLLTWLTSTSTTLPLNQQVSVPLNPTGDTTRVVNGTFGTDPYTISFYFYDDTTNPTGSPVCQINVPAGVAGGGGDNGGGDSWDIDLGNYLTRTESSLPNTL